MKGECAKSERRNGVRAVFGERRGWDVVATEKIEGEFEGSRRDCARLDAGDGKEVNGLGRKGPWESGGMMARGMGGEKEATAKRKHRAGEEGDIKGR